MKNRPDQSEPRKSPPGAASLKPYATPTLTTFGDVAQLTKGSSHSARDGNGQATRPS